MSPQTSGLGPKKLGGEKGVFPPIFRAPLPAPKKWFWGNSQTKRRQFKIWQPRALKYTSRDSPKQSETCVIKLSSRNIAENHLYNLYRSFDPKSKIIKSGQSSNHLLSCHVCQTLPISEQESPTSSSTVHRPQSSSGCHGLVKSWCRRHGKHIHMWTTVSCQKWMGTDMEKGTPWKIPTYTHTNTLKYPWHSKYLKITQIYSNHFKPCRAPDTPCLFAPRTKTRHALGSAKQVENVCNLNMRLPRYVARPKHCSIIVRLSSGIKPPQIQ